MFHSISLYLTRIIKIDTSSLVTLYTLESWIFVVFVVSVIIILKCLREIALALFKTYMQLFSLIKLK